MIIHTYRDIQEIVSRNPQKPLTFLYRRNGETRQTIITPELNKDTGAGRIGVYAWIDPIVEGVRKDSAGYIAGIKKGDTILKADGEEVPHTLFLLNKLSQARSKPVRLVLLRDGKTIETDLLPHFTDTGVLDTGLSFKPIVFTARSETILQSFKKGSRGNPRIPLPIQSAVLRCSSRGLTCPKLYLALSALPIT